MTLKEAYEYKRSFYRYYKKNKSELKHGHILLKGERSFFSLNISNTDTVPAIHKEKMESTENFNTIEISIDKFLFNFTEINKQRIEYYFHFYNIEKIYIIKEEAALTSQGLINWDEFYLAEDILKTTQFLRKKDLDIGSVYLGLNGNRYIYVSDNYIFNSGYRYKDQLIEESTGIFRNRSSIKLVEFIKKTKGNKYF